VARLVGINHVALEVGDLDEALDFYGSLFEFELRGRVPGIVFLDLGDQFLAMIHNEDREPDAERHFGLVVDDREAVRRSLGEKGIETLPWRPSTLGFRDPWGNSIEVVEYSAIQFTKPPAVLAGMGLGGLEKSDEALDELREKGLTD
jgi:lactoylglutathione lyase